MEWPFTSRNERSVFFFVLVLITYFVLFDDIEFDRIQSDDLQIGPALLARNRIALVSICIDMDVSVALRACSGWHFPNTSNVKLTAVVHPVSSWGEPPPCL